MFFFFDILFFERARGRERAAQREAEKFDEKKLYVKFSLLEIRNLSYFRDCHDVRIDRIYQAICIE